MSLIIELAVHKSCNLACILATPLVQTQMKLSILRTAPYDFALAITCRVFPISLYSFGKDRVCLYLVQIKTSSKYFRGFAIFLSFVIGGIALKYR